MASQPPVEMIRCPSCGAWMAVGSTRCWLCHQEFVDAILPAPPEMVGSDAPPQFALSTLLLTITLACICLGLYAAAPGLLIPLLFIVVPALLRLEAAGRSAEQKGKKLSPAAMIMHFLVGVGLVILAWVGAGVAFLGACAIMLAGFGGGPGDSGGRAMVIAGLAAFIVLLIVMVITWPRVRKTR